MHFRPEKLKLSEAEFVILRNLIVERTGLFYNDNKRDLLEDKLSTLVLERGFSAFLDYYYLLKYDTTAVDEWCRLVDALRVPETYFKREFDQIQALVETILPTYLTLHPKLPLRIWSAACSSGEEPLTIAIALTEAGWFERTEIEIIASDLSHYAINQARNGLYRNYALRNLPPTWQEKYFTAEANNLWRIVPQIHRRVKWTNANLTSKSEIAMLANANFVYCRNVFIYFSEETVRRTIRQFFELMCTPGYLFVGASESLLKLTTDFELQEIHRAFVYVKR